MSTRSVYWATALAVAAWAATPRMNGVDPRELSSGRLIGNMSSGYVDQPYCLVLPATADATPRWLCTATYNSLPEGHPGEHVVTTYSDDLGATWSKLLPMEPDTSLEYAYSTLLPGPNGRVYDIYVENSDNVTHLPNGQYISRTDMMGHFWMKWSDDRGESWSDERVEVPIRSTSIDATNTWNGTVRIMWEVDKGFVDGKGRAFVAFTKIGTYCIEPPTSSWVLSSSNLLTAANPRDVAWTLLPDGDDGIHNWPGTVRNTSAPGISSEPHVVPLGEDGRLYIVFRTTTGALGGRSSADGGRTWQYLSHANVTSPNAQYSCGGRSLKNPRGPTTPRFIPREYLASQGLDGGLRDGESGAYLLLYYNNGNTDYAHRNPYWLAAGFLNAERNNVLWSSPEVGLYNNDTKARGPGYPDFILDSSGIYITETEKVHARSHLVSPDLLRGLFNSRDASGAPAGASVTGKAGDTITMPTLPELAKARPGSGFSVAVWLDGATEDSDGPLFDTRPGGSGAGLVLSRDPANGTTTASLYDASGKVVVSITSSGCEGGCPGELWWQERDRTAGPAFVGVTVDGAASVISMVVDGRLCDGGDSNAYGWGVAPEGNFNNPSSKASVGTGVRRLAVYTRALSTASMVAASRGEAPGLAL